MTLNLVRSDSPRKDTRSVVFNIEGRKASVAFPKTLFGANAPDKLSIEGEFADPRTAKAPETKEERKARLAALPKLTLAEKIAKREEALSKMKAKLAGGDAPAAQPAAQPAA